MNWFSLGNGVPHLHVHLVPRPLDDARPGRPVESEAFDFASIPAVDAVDLAAAAAALRARLRD
jgi:diadenosine tetraphosphate (Ap4A) HIT family hydrolase